MKIKGLDDIPASGWKTYAVALALAAVALAEGVLGMPVPGVTLDDNWLLVLLNALGLATLRHGVTRVLDRWLRPD